MNEEKKTNIAAAEDAHASGGNEASLRSAETARPSHMAGGDAGTPSAPAQSGGKYAGEPGPAGVRGENHMDPLRVDEDAEPDGA